MTHLLSWDTSYDIGEVRKTWQFKNTFSSESCSNSYHVTTHSPDVMKSIWKFQERQGPWMCAYDLYKFTKIDVNMEEFD